MKQKAICILGTHRSGTSMITRIINLMGIYLGEADDLIPPAENINPEGFWENIRIVNIHEEILRELKSSWHSTVPMPSEWWKLPEIEKYKIDLINLIKDKYNSASVWAFKDPRTCIILPLWKEVLNILDVDVEFIIPIRNPLDVAKSLEKRDHFLLSKSICLWYYNMISILEETQGYKRIFIKYDDILEEPTISLKKLSNFLSIDISEEEKSIITNTIKPNLRHSKTSKEELKSVAGEEIAELYNILLKLAENSDSEAILGSYSLKDYKAFSKLIDIHLIDDKSL